MMMILKSFITIVLFKSYSCWIINDINTKILAEHLNQPADDLREANFLREINFIYPGTLWCGPGSVAESFEDLGTEKETDMCCRAHDNCPDYIEGVGSKYNLTNSVFYTRLSCDCDNTFHTCLKAAGTQSAKVVGNMYFNALQTKCFREDYPVINCTRKGGWFQTKCLEYSHDTTKEKLYQWFDVLSY